jgi:hypothetical protein
MKRSREKALASFPKWYQMLYFHEIMAHHGRQPHARGFHNAAENRSN